MVDDENDPSLAFRHALSLGSPPRRLQAAPAREEAQVGAVRFIGELGLPQTELQSRLRVKAGDRFDFYRWQRDRDELERFYADRDYLEARVRPRRIEEVDGTVTLAYQIVRGPRSVLTIEGYDLPGGVIEQMRDTWNRSVFDGFLLDELRTLAREHLGSDGLLQAVVDAEVLDRPGDDQKEIVLRIEAGPRTTDHRIMLQGNERLTSEELQLFLTRQGIDETAWADPEPITRSLVALYQAEGMLDAQVAVGQPEFGVNTATLPVRITEGPTFHMSEVTIEGVEAFSATAVQSLVRPEAGDVYSGVEISDARVRVDQTYRQAGFNEARVTARSAVDRDSETVSVVLDVNEGPRQIVEEVEIVGRDRSNEKLVSSALQVSPGQPVDLGAWNRARKRLYDTGAFRNVDIAAEPMDQSAADVKPGEQPVRARVLLEEWPAYRLRYGLQLKNEESPLAEQVTREVNVGLVGDLTRQNFVGRAITLGTAFRWDTNDRVLRGFVRTPSFLGLPITSNVFVAQQHEVIGEISGISELQDLTRLTLEQRFQPRSNFTVAYSYNFDRSHDFTETPVPGAPIQLDIKTDVARLAGTTVIDTRDDLFDATRGWFHSSTVEFGPEALGSDLRFLKYTGQQFHYWDLGNDLVLASAVRLGLGAGLGGQDLSVERFETGGGNTVRGYSQDSLGPVIAFPRFDPDVDQPLISVVRLGGDALLVLNQELRFPLYRFVRGVGFLDAGNIFPTIGDLSFSNLKVGLGLGVRVDTPIGLFRFDFAAPLSDTPFSRAVSDLQADPFSCPGTNQCLEADGDGKSRFFFSIGQVF